MKTVRFDSQRRRFVLNFPREDPAMFDVKRIEGRRWEKDIRAWTTPPTLHAWKKLADLGFAMLQHGGGSFWLDWLRAGCAIPAHEMPHHLPEDLFPYQREGVARILRQDRLLLADDMGLGKTKQAIVSLLRDDLPKVVIAPKVLLRPWYEALIAHDVHPQHIGVRLGGITDHAWSLINPEFLHRFFVQEGQSFLLCVDEAHLFTNHHAKRTKGMLRLAEEASKVLLLTGTPPAHPTKVWPFMLALGARRPKEFFPFMLRYAAAYDNGFGWDYSGAVHLDELAEELQPYTLRRTKDQVLDDLPPKLYSTVLAEDGFLKREERELYGLDEEILSLVSRGHSLGGSLGVGALQRLRGAASKSKLVTTVELLAARLPAKQLVFCEFRETMERIEGMLRAEVDGVQVSQLHGDLSDDDRVRRVKEFTDVATGVEGGGGAVLICQYQLASLGLDLQAATCVVIHDLPWTPEQLDQAIDRAHRIGQRDSVHVITVLSRSHVEAQMLEGLREGRKITDAVYRQERTK